MVSWVPGAEAAPPDNLRDIASQMAAPAWPLPPDLFCQSVHDVAQPGGDRLLLATVGKATDRWHVRWVRSWTFPAIRRLASSAVTPNHITYLGISRRSARLWLDRAGRLLAGDCRGALAVRLLGAGLYGWHHGAVDVRGKRLWPKARHHSRTPEQSGDFQRLGVGRLRRRGVVEAGRRRLFPAGRHFDGAARFRARKTAASEPRTGGCWEAASLFGQDQPSRLRRGDFDVDGGARRAHFFVAQPDRRAGVLGDDVGVGAEASARHGDAP